MKTTIKQAENNERNLTIKMIGYGHWKIECYYKHKYISTVTTNSTAIDNFNSEFGEKDECGCNRRKTGYESLVNEIINANEN